MHTTQIALLKLYDLILKISEYEFTVMNVTWKNWEQLIVLRLQFEFIYEKFVFFFRKEISF